MYLLINCPTGREPLLHSYQLGLERDGQVLLKGLHPAPALCEVSLTAGKVLEASLPLFPFHRVAVMPLRKFHESRAGASHPQHLLLSPTVCSALAFLFPLSSSSADFPFSTTTWLQPHRRQCHRVAVFHRWKLNVVTTNPWQHQLQGAGLLPNVLPISSSSQQVPHFQGGSRETKHYRIIES